MEYLEGKTDIQNRLLAPAPNEEGIVTTEMLKYFVTIGTHAPSGDNAQPWQFIWDGASLVINEDRTRSGFFLDLCNESTWIAFGALVENIKIAASSYGLAVSWKIQFAGPGQGASLRLTFKRSAVARDPLSLHVLRRCVNRRAFKRRDVAAELLQQISREATKIQDVRFDWIARGEERAAFKEVTVVGDRMVFQEKQLHETLFRWVQFNESALTGLPVSVLGLNFMERITLPLIRSWAVLSRLNKLGMHRMFALHSYILMQSAPEYCVIALKDTSPEGYVRAGMALERAWIKANAVGLSVQPMSAGLFLLNFFRERGAADFSPAAAVTLPKLEKRLRSVWEIEQKGIPVLLLRVGYARPPQARTRRLPLEQVLKTVGS